MSADRKIIVDEDWKEQAQREKEALAAAVEAERARKAAPPPASFALLLSSFAAQAFIGLGEQDDPLTGKKEANLPQARFAIDMLEILQAKTKGNLDAGEAQALEGLLFDLRMRYVKRAKG
jgi:hypothetical protein